MSQGNQCRRITTNLVDLTVVGAAVVLPPVLT